MSTKLAKFLSAILTIALLVNLLPAQALGATLRSIWPGAEDAGENLFYLNEMGEPGDTTIIGEIESKRTEYTKEYLMSNGLNMVVVYPEAVHYKQGETWEEIDNTLKMVGTGKDSRYVNTAGEWSVSFPQQLSESKQVSVTRNGYVLSFGFAGELTRTERLETGAAALNRATEISGTELELDVKLGNVANAVVEQLDLSALRESMEYPETFVDTIYSQLKYSNVYENTDIVYDLGAKELKESIVIEAYDPNLYGYRYTLNVGTMIPVLESDGSILLYSADQSKLIMKMPAPYMIDDSGAVNYDVDVTLTQKGTEYVLTYQVPTEWLAEESRTWPVVLDPIVQADTSGSNVLDHFVAEYYAESNSAGYLMCGYNSDFGKMRTFIKFTNIPTLSAADVLVNANLSLMYLGGTTGDTIIGGHKVNGDWTTGSITWANQPNHDSAIEDYAKVGNSGRYNWNITDIARGWYETGNTGIMLKALDSIENGASNNWKKFYSVDYSIYGTHLWPVLTIIYRNTSGIESYWDYTAHGAGRAGMGYINNYSGNLVWVRTDLGFGGNRMPVSISHIYNANYVGDTNVAAYGIGNGWKTNYNQRAYKPTGTDYYVWEDGDGTRHCFFYDAENAVYVDEDGLELKLTVDASSVTIEDKNGNKSYFDLTYGRLYKIANNQEISSAIDITYVASNSYKIATIKDGVDRAYNFSYNSSGLLDKITYVGKGTTEISSVSYAYTGTDLTGVTDKDGKSSTYTYASGYLISATDIDGYRLNYTYTETSPKRVIGVEEQQVKDDNTVVAGGKLTITYSQNQTRFEDHDSNVQIMQFNDWGNTISIQDGEGRAQYAQYALNGHGDDGNSTDDATIKANQLRISSRMQNTVVSGELAGNFENDVSHWSGINDAVTMSSSDEEAYYGNKSIKIVRTTAGSASGARGDMYTIDPYVTIPQTFSAYVKTGEGANAMLAFLDRLGNPLATSNIVGSNSDWVRLQVTYTPIETDETLYVYPAVLTTNAGTVYVDCAQIEKMTTASRYNLIDRSDDWGDLTNAWVKSSGMTSSDKRIDMGNNLPALYMNKYALSITGDPSLEKYVTQTINQSGAAGDCYVLAGWAYGNAVPSGTNTDETVREFGLRLIFNNTDGTTDSQFISFSPNIPTGSKWQYVATPAVAKAAYSSITVQVVYNYGANTVWFDGIQLFKESFGNSYEYDEDGNVKSVTDLQRVITNYEYTSNNLTRILENNKATMRYEYDSWHNVTKAVTQTQDAEGNTVDNIVYQFEYDDYGNNTLVKIGDGEKAIRTSATYTADFNRLLTTTDELANVTTYCYNENTNVLEWVQYPNESETTRTTYTYDAMYRLATASAGVYGLSSGTALTADYTYTDDLLTKIETGTTTYSFSYGDFAQRSSIQIGSRTLASYAYKQDENRYLNKLTYGNGDYVEYDYDDEGRVTLETFEDGSTVSYTYDNTGALATMTDSKTGRQTTYYYDLTDRMVKYVESSSGYSHGVEYAYDGRNNLTKLVETINGVQHTTDYTYDFENRLTQTAYGSITESIEYDEYGRMDMTRVKNNNTSVLRSEFQYAYSSRTASDTTRLSNLQVIGASGDTLRTYYSYTADGNIERYDIYGANTYYGGAIDTPAPTRLNENYYYYDSANQLIREDNTFLNKTLVWTYDDGGNITSYQEYAFTLWGEEVTGEPTLTRTYTYGDSEWGDLLTAYNGVQWSYDGIGNLTSDGTWSYTWQNGRELASMSNGTTTWNYTYDANGMRTSRSNGSTTYTYVYNGGQLVQMTKGSDTLYFTYGAIGPTTVTWNGTTYYYAVNAQGDVVGIFDGSGNCVVTYNWDNAWGYNPEPEGSLASTLGTLNPLRYRSYVYDEETELYYLQSRYYNPEVCRFINADAFVATGQGMLGNNMFAYCANNPVRYCDPSGNAFIEAIIAAVGTEWAITIVIGGVIVISDVVYKTLEVLFDWLSKQWYRPFTQITYAKAEEVEETLPHQGLVEGDPEAPPVDAGQQGKHVQGHNNYDPDKSSWPKGKNGVAQTQEAWKNGVQDPKKPAGQGKIGIASDGTVVRVHIKADGSIHGYPLFQAWFPW